ncbi:MAG TPA: HRDC domain-containing protein [Gemmataceae bacterium]|nr:HRDC domain-containing protein [Gemmataceae bacterium]
MSELPEQIVTTPQELGACCEHLAACRRFGFDTEFVGENTYHPHLCLVQVATSERLFLIDPLAVGPLDAFWRLVVDPQNVVVVHAGREEVRLCRLWAGQTPDHFFDLQIAAGLVGLAYPLGAGALIHQLLGVQLAKAETLTEWRDRPLTAAQVRYAFDDVRYLLAAHERVAGRLDSLRRADWASEDFARMAAAVTPEEVPAEKWRKLRGLGSLDRRRLAIVRSIYNWREETAARMNRPARTIVRDDLIVEIARRNPARERDLQPIRGLPRRDLPAILQAVEVARALPPEQWPRAAEREQDPPQVGLVANVLQAVLGDFCARHQLAPGLVATSSDVKLLVRARMQGAPPPAESLLTQGWRARHVLPELLAVLEGRRSLRIVNVRADSPFVVEDVGGK